MPTERLQVAKTSKQQVDLRWVNFNAETQEIFSQKGNMTLPKSTTPQ
jgi:hypothetical protein